MAGWQADAVIFFAFEDEEKPLPGLEKWFEQTQTISGSRLLADLKGKQGRTVVGYAPETAAAPRLVLAGLGPRDKFDLDRLRMPLSVRTRRPGDRFRPLGLGGEKKLHDFFIDRRVPRSMRDRVPLVVADHRPVWIVGYAIDDRAGVNESTTRLLKLTAQHPEGR